MAKFKMPSTTALLFNGAAILVAGASGVAVMRSALFKDASPPCSERYEHGTRLSLDRGGEALTAADLQAHLGNTDWGLLGGSRVVKLKTGPGKHALEIDLASAPAAGAETLDKPAGVGFIWAPQGMARARAACLAYSLFVPEGFGFGKGGRLPGLMGGAAPTTGEDAARSAFSTRLTWSADGKVDVLAQIAAWPEARPLLGTGNGFTLERGRWTSIEQEVVLNGAGQKDGMLRLWVNGQLVVNRTDIVFRAKPSSMLSAVLAETTGGAPVPGTPRGSQKIWLSPFELRWQ